jgi:hypothetical protein
MYGIQGESVLRGSNKFVFKYKDLSRHRHVWMQIVLEEFQTLPLPLHPLACTVPSYPFADDSERQSLCIGCRG